MEVDLAKVLKKLWGGAIEYEDDDTPLDILSFNAFGKSAVLWLEQSRALHWAAVSLKKGDERGKTGPRAGFDHVIALMLGGYAVEALLKMVVIADHCEAHGFTLDSKSAKEFLPATHDLRKLAAQAKLRINVKDRAVLTSLSRYTVWAGRYPIPLFAADYPGPAIFDDIGAERLAAQHEQWRQYDSLYRKLHRLAVRKIFRESAVRE
jgi:hypothetical protein